MSDESIWKTKTDLFTALEHLSQKRALHPALLDLIEGVKGNRMLDYGCGDGRILENVSTRWEIEAYDPSEQMRQLALRRVGHRLHQMADSPSELEGPYDVILLGMVILVLSRAEEIRRVFRECALRMGNASRLFVTTTHPCFRNVAFSNFTTSFGDTQVFDYMQDGTPFQVRLRDPGTDGIIFTDYHWSLAFTLNALHAEGLSVVSMVEVPDDPDSSNRNTLVPPFLIMVCRRFL